MRLRLAFTLVELLVVIMIIGIMASLATVALWDAQDAARASRTRAQVQKIHELLMIRWESYATRPVPIRTSRLPPELAAKARLNALRQLMRMELPDRITDVTDGPAPVLSSPVVTMGTPSLNLAYWRRADRDGDNDVDEWSAPNQQAECLYMILASIQDGTRNGLDFFRQNEIGDTDADGMQEVLDGWGQPIRFLRWAPGYLSDLQNPGDRQPDPFDPMRLDPRWKNNSAEDRHYPDSYPSTTPADSAADDPHALYPLVYSAGADGIYGVLHDIFQDQDADGMPSEEDDRTGFGPEYASAPFPLHYGDTDDGTSYPYTPYPCSSGVPWPTKTTAGPLWQFAPKNDPYVILPGVGVQIGTRYGTGAADNIDNQSLLVK